MKDTTNVQKIKKYHKHHKRHKIKKNTAGRREIINHSQNDKQLEEIKAQKDKLKK